MQPTRSPVDLLLKACKAGMPCGGNRSKDMVPALPIHVCINAVDSDGVAPLSLAMRNQRWALVPTLLELRADINRAEMTSGSTALMIASACGARDVVSQLLQAHADVKVVDVHGRSAIDVAASADLRKFIEEHVNREVVNRKLRTACSLPTLMAKSGSCSAAKVCRNRIRLDGLSRIGFAEDVEEYIRELLEDYRISPPQSVIVEVHPISLRPRGHAFVEFSSARRAESAERILRQDDDISVSIEGAPFSAQCI